MNRMIMAILAVVLLANGACVTKPPKKQFQLLAGEFVSPVHITKPVDQQSAVTGITIKSSASTHPIEPRQWTAKQQQRLAARAE